jgi:uncharacterized protein YbjT (DUF2867 family)
MKVVIIGGTGLIGKQVAALLGQGGHEVLAAAPSTGVNTLTGEGLAQALQGAQVVVDVSNSPSFEAAAVMDFFQTATRNILSAATAAGVRHVVALSIVGTERLPESGYFLAKLAQEQMIRGSALPHTIVRATQFHEFLGAIADAATREGRVHAPSAGIQPIASADVAAAVARAATAEPVNGLTEIAGPVAFRMDELLRGLLQQRGDAREVVTDESAGYFGAPLKAGTLLPGAGAWLAPTTLQAWSTARAAATA